MFPDLVVTSGLAFGVDAAAHHAAIDGSVRTVGVVANPLPGVTPAQHTVLAKGIVKEGGAIVTELSSATKQNGNYYIPRNRIVAAVSEGLLVVESPANGGSLSTVRAADSYARTIMAVPGRIGDSMSVGTNHLIKSNLAHLVTSAEDIAEALGWHAEGAMPEKLHYEPREMTSLEAQIMGCFVDGGDPVSLDEIAERCAITTAEASAKLLDMELSGVVRQLPGKFYDKMI
jgi:DNA processing protein